MVLGMVKKYPLHSLNKLSEMLPEVSRHSIQRILEKNKLSKVEERLAFSSEKKFEPLPILEKLKNKVSDFFDKKDFNFKLLEKADLEIPFYKIWGKLKILLIAIVVISVFLYAKSWVDAEHPKITLEIPSADSNNRGEEIYVSGTVFPKNSRVSVNGEKVYLNGDGSFTSVVNIPIGKSTLEVEAVNKGKKSQVLRLVNRIKTAEELEIEKEEKAEREKEVVDKVAGLESTINDLLAAKEANAQKQQLRILNNRVKKEAGFSSIVGEVRNLGDEKVSWVMITVSFLDKDGGLMEEKFGFATDFGETIKPGKSAKFETQSTQKEFDRYSLALSWEEDGEEVEKKEPVESTKSAEIEKEAEKISLPKKEEKMPDDED